uniref:TldD/PmbA family protein n=1 Tax=Caldimicrobium thiodismutans TaxID=1653476 RepID=A0A832GN03_9BACT
MKRLLYSDLYFEKRDFLRVTVEPDKVEELSSGSERGLAFRKIFSDFQNHYTYLTDNYHTLLKENKLPFARDSLAEFGTRMDSLLNESPFSLSIDKIFSFLEDLKKNIPTSPHIKHYRLSLSQRISQVLLLASDGALHQTTRTYFRVMALVVAERDGRLERGYEAKGYTLSMEEALRVDPDLLKVSQKACELALLMLDAKKAPAGVMPVILAGEAGGTMIHEAVGHGLEADHAEEGLSVYSGRLGEKVASPLITVIDDPTLPHLYGSYEIDDEGTKALKTVLIEKGILKDFLYDRYTALKYNKKPNGHGRRESFRHLPIPRMSNTYIAPGPHKKEEILRSIDKGLLVKKMGGGEVNPLTGDFVFEVREGYYLEKGEICYPVKGALLVGNGPKVLESIDMVSDDLHFEAGTCGKDGQGVPVSDGQPSLRIPEITVSGSLE